MSANKSILYISESIPAATFASPVVFFRHLKRLEANGWKINLIVSNTHLDQISFPTTWQVKVLPSRRWWYPPYRNNFFSQRLRHYILWWECREFIQETKPAFILGYIWGTYLSSFATFLSDKFSIPSGFFLHDNEVEWYKRLPEKVSFLNNIHYTLARQASVIWSVSNRLHVGNFSMRNKHKILMPIPEGYQGRNRPEWKSDFAYKPIVAYSGTIQASHAPLFIQIAQLLKEMHGRLVIITKEQHFLTELPKNLDNIDIQSPFPLLDALDFLQKEASAILVCYPEELTTVPWVASSFPSKFVEYTHLGLPILVLTPNNTAFADWCEVNHYLGFTTNYAMDALRFWLKPIVDEKRWKAMARQSAELASRHFNPDEIHKIFELDIETITESNQ